MLFMAHDDLPIGFAIPLCFTVDYESEGRGDDIYREQLLTFFGLPSFSADGLIEGACTMIDQMSGLQSWLDFLEGAGLMDDWRSYQCKEPEAMLPCHCLSYDNFEAFWQVWRDQGGSARFPSRSKPGDGIDVQ